MTAVRRHAENTVVSSIVLMYGHYSIANYYVAVLSGHSYYDCHTFIVLLTKLIALLKLGKLVWTKKDCHSYIAWTKQTAV